MLKPVRDPNPEAELPGPTPPRQQIRREALGDALQAVEDQNDDEPNTFEFEKGYRMGVSNAAYAVRQLLEREGGV